MMLRNTQICVSNKETHSCRFSMFPFVDFYVCSLYYILYKIICICGMGEMMRQFFHWYLGINKPGQRYEVDVV